MGGSRTWALIVAALAGAPAASLAQIPGIYQLPKGDFIWNWGRAEGGRSPGAFEDFSVDGTEGGFRCQLTGQMRGTSQYSPSDIRLLEMELQGRLDFIYAVSNAMNELDRQHVLEWARLACAMHQAQESTPEEKAEREAKAKEKMQREIDRRREREQREQD